MQFVQYKNHYVCGISPFSELSKRVCVCGIFIQLFGVALIFDH